MFYFVIDAYELRTKSLFELTYKRIETLKTFYAAKRAEEERAENTSAAVCFTTTSTFSQY